MSIAERVDRRDAKTRILRKVLVSFALGTVAYSITELTGQEQIWSITLSVFIGGVTLVVQFLIEFENRLAGVEAKKEQHSAKIEDMVESGFARISEVTQLFSLVEASALRTDAVTQLLRHATQINPDGPPLISRFAQSEISRMSDFLKELSEGGDVSYEGEDRDWLLALTRNVETSIDATSLTTVDAGGRGHVDGGFWPSDLGQRYLDAQRDAVQRGVRIRRVFVLHRAGLAADADLGSLCRLQKDIGIDVRLLDWAAVAPTRRETLFDFVLFDDDISYETTPASRFDDSTPPMILNTRLELRPHRVRSRVQVFRELWETAHPFD